MKIIKENTTRRIDNLGRISLPKSMRDRIGIEAGDEISFYLIENNGVQYIGCAKEDMAIKDERKRIAAEVLAELGYDIPEELV